MVSSFYQLINYAIFSLSITSNSSLSTSPNNSPAQETDRYEISVHVY